MSRLTSGNTRSCGCLRAEKALQKVPAMAARNRTHGLAGQGQQAKTLYGTWRAMMQRCYNPQHRYYHRYGGRGIIVWEPWHDAARFVADIQAIIGPRPPGRTLDRADNDGNYEPGNIRWATPLQQSRNSSRRR